MPPLRASLAAAPLAVIAAALAAGAARPAATAGVGENPCLGPEAARLLCPDLRMKRPFGMYVERRRGRTLLRAGNSIDNVGAGPAEVRGVRVSRYWMRGRQRIYERGGGRLGVRTGARLYFKYAHLQRRWWKLYRAARFELWRVDGSGRRTRLVRTGPKLAYCLRDLRRTHPRLRRSPRHAHYPACSTNPAARRVTLGTSVGWSDIYPPAYPEQWIDVTGLRGCFAYVHVADPLNAIFESDEENNRAQAIARLPFRRGDRRGACHGRDTGEVDRRSGPY